MKAGMEKMTTNSTNVREERDSTVTELEKQEAAAQELKMKLQDLQMKLPQCPH